MTSPGQAGNPARLPVPAGQILHLAQAVASADAVGALSEQFRLNLDSDSAGVSHHVRLTPTGDVVGYAQVDARDGSPGSAELFVHPDHRRVGYGSELLQRVGAGVPIWAHGSTPAATGFATARGLRIVRELHKMRRDLVGSPLRQQGPEDVDLPEGFTLRRFDPAVDGPEWIRVNALAFAGHPEQGRLTLADLGTRMAESWFDPDGLLLIVPTDQPTRIAAYHFTKQEPGSAVGEVYVVGVDPAYQGRRLGSAVTLAGLAHLRQHGVREIVLYVDDSNVVAKHTYDSLGFEIVLTDRMYVL